MGKGGDGGDGEAGATGEDKADPRLEFLESWVALKLNVKPEKFAKLLLSSETAAPINHFLSNPDCRRLFVQGKDKDNKELLCGDLPPLALKRRAVYFTKLERQALTADNMGALVAPGDLLPDALTQLHTLCEAVYLPLLAQPGNSPGWPAPIVSEMADGLTRLSALVYVTLGQSQGRTLLPLPSEHSQAERRASESHLARDKDKVHAFEQAVVTWTRQIKGVLKGDPEAAMEKGGMIVSHPGPLHELSFWTTRKANLASIRTQLHSTRVRRVVRVLELTQSTYCTAFARLEADVEAASEEADNNVAFLETLREDLEMLETLPPDAFTELPARFAPLMHRVLLVWCHSKFYNVPARLAVLLRQMSSALVERAREFVDADSIFSLEPQEALDRLTSALEVCAAFKAAYFGAKETSESRAPENPWKFQNSVIFARLDLFIERCHDLHELAQSVVQFSRLERIEIGGNKGRSLSASIAQMHADFTQTIEHFQTITYDVLDIADKRFDDDFYSFRTDIKQVERRLASVLNTGYDDCATLTSSFKLIDAFEGLLERDSLQADLQRKQAELMSQYADDLREVSRLFHKERVRSADGFYLERDGPPLYDNMPPVAGSIYWVRGLIERVSAPMAKFRGSMSRVLEAEESAEVLGLHESLLAMLVDYGRKAFDEWCGGLEETSTAKLRQPLLVRDPSTRLLSVNFDPDLVRLLREVFYLQQVSDSEIPPAATELSRQREPFRVLRGNLQLIVGKYNQMLLTIMDVERPLLEREMKAMDSLLEQGLTHLTWKSVDVQSFVKQALHDVSSAHAKLFVLKDNLRQVEEVIEKWVAAPLMRRKGTATYAPQDFAEQHKPYVKGRYAEVVEGGKTIHRLMLASNAELKVSKGAPSWKAYVEYVSEIVVDGLARLVGTSLQFVTDQVNPESIAKNELLPMLEIQLELVPPNVIFSPRLANDPSLEATRVASATLNEGGEQSAAPVIPIGGMVQGWVSDFFGVCKLIKRLDRAEGDFFNEVQEHEGIKFQVHTVTRSTERSFGVAEELIEPYAAYKHLWTADIQGELRHFLLSRGRSRSGGGGGGSSSITSSSGGGGEDGGASLAGVMARHLSEPAKLAMSKLSEMMLEPELSVFEAAIAEKKAKADEVAAMPVTQVRGWLRLDCKPAKQALSTWVTKWMFAYTQHLHDNLTTCIDVLVAWMEDVHLGLSRATDEPDVLSEEELTAAMTHIHAVDQADADVDELFEPMRGIVNLLRKYGIALSDATVEQLERLPYEWEDTRKLTEEAGETLADRKAANGRKIAADAEAFTNEVTAFRAAFKSQAPFSYDLGIEDCYAAIDLWFGKIAEIEQQADSLRDREHLFDVKVHPWKELTTCQQELLALKLVWDHAALVEYIFSDWKATPWAKVDCDGCYSHAKRLQAQFLALEKRIKSCGSWGVFQGVTSSLADMLVTLPLVQDLRDEAMRERHWKKLMRICGKTFVLDDKFCLNDLLKLQLHLFADSVGEIVEQARQEIKIDKHLNKIETVWLNLQLEYAPFKSTGVQVLVEASLGPVYEALDEHEAALQAMGGNRFVGFFESAVASWKGKLGGVRGTLDAWVEVQRSWCSLESIFLASEDIREQLPEDAKRFDGIDASFKEQMADASQTASPEAACLKDGRMEALQACQVALDLCSRSLSDYLETKRKKFPRFYFISAVPCLPRPPFLSVPLSLPSPPAPSLAFPTFRLLTRRRCRIAQTLLHRPT